MGVWAGGPDATRVDVEGIAAAMRPAVEMWMTAHIQILDLQRPVGGEPVVVLDSGPRGALVQPLRSPTAITVGSQPTNLLGIRFQVKRSAEVAEGETLRAGLIVKVLDGGNEPGLTEPTFSLGEAVDSSLAWDRILEASTVTGGY